MRYRVEIKASARKRIVALPRPAQRRVVAAVAALAETPRPAGARKIVGAEDAYRIRLGDYRVVYQVLDRILVVYVVRVGHRKDVYRGL